MVSAMSFSSRSIDSSESLLWKETKRTAASLSLNKLVFEAGAAWPLSSSVGSCSSSSSSTSTTTLTLLVPKDFASVAAAVNFANQEFQKHARSMAKTTQNQHNSNPTGTEPSESDGARLAASKIKTIKVLVDPASLPACSVQETLKVQAHKYGHLVLDVVRDECKTSNLSINNPNAPNKRPRLSTYTKAELAQTKAVLSMETPVPNKPLIQITSGSLTVRNMRLEHYSPVDVFVLAKTRSRNAVLVVDHEQGPHEDCIRNIKLEHVVLTSYAGRGIIKRCQDSCCQITQSDCFIAKLFSRY